MEFESRDLIYLVRNCSSELLLGTVFHRVPYVVERYPFDHFHKHPFEAKLIFGRRIESINDGNWNSSRMPDEFRCGDVALNFVMGIDR